MVEVAFVSALGPSLLRTIFGNSSGLLNGATVAVLCGAGAVSPLMLRGLAALVQQRLPKEEAHHDPSV